jgi:hypothetical protein
LIGGAWTELQECSIVIVPALACGCHDLVTHGDILTPPIGDRGPMSGDRSRRSGKTDFDFEAGEQRHARMSVEERLAEARLFNRLFPALALPPAEIFVTSDPLPDGTLALIVRDRSSAVPRLIVVSERDHLDSAVLAGARALATDEERNPAAAVERRIRVSHDGRLTDDAGIEFGRLEDSSPGDAAASPVLPRGVPSAEMVLPRIGKGRFLRF